MRWYGEEGVEEVSKEFHLSAVEGAVPDFVVHVLEVLLLFQATADGEAIVELLASELDLLTVGLILDDPDEVPRGEAGIVEDFEGALGGEVAGMVLEAGDFLRCGGSVGRGGVLFASPLEDLGAVETPDGHAGGLYAMTGAEVGAGLPAVGGAGRRVIEEEEEFVEEWDGLAVGVLGVLEPMKKRVEPRDFRRRWLGWVIVGFGERVRVGGNHSAAILRQLEKNAVGLYLLKRLFSLK